MVDVERNLTPSIRFYSIGSGESYFIGDDTIFCFNSRYDKETNIDSVAGFSVTFRDKLNGGYEAYNRVAMMSHFYLPHATLMDVQSYNTLKQYNIWNDVDLTINGNGQLEYLFKAKYIAAFNQIRMKFDGIVGDIEDRDEGIKINTVGESTIYDKIIAYQIIQGEARVLSINRNHSANELWFDVMQTLHDDSPIYLYIGRVPTYVLPAALYWSTYIKASNEYPTDVITDATENVYFGGSTGSINYPLQINTNYITPTWKVNKGGFDGIVGKFDNLRRLNWRAFIGGSFNDGVNALALDYGIGNNQTLAVVGNTVSSDFAGIANSFICIPCIGYKDLIRNDVATATMEDGFVIRFNTDGKFSNNNKNMATYFGGDGSEQINAAVFDRDNNLYIGGVLTSTTLSTTFPRNHSSSQFFMDDANQPSSSFWREGFLSKFDSNQNLVWSTLFGGKSSPTNYDLDEIKSLGIKNGYNLVAYGVTGNQGAVLSGPISGLYSGLSFPLVRYSTNPFCYIENNKGKSDCFLAEFNQSNQLIYSSLFGGIDEENEFAQIGIGNATNFNTLFIDNDNELWIGGKTKSNNVNQSTFHNFPLQPLIGYPTAYFNNQSGFAAGQIDGFLAKFSEDYKLLYSTFWGGNSNDGITGITKVNNSLLVSGTTRSYNLITKPNNQQITYFNPLLNGMSASSSNSNSDAFLFILNDINLSLTYSSFFGGNGDDCPVGLAHFLNSDHFFMFGISEKNYSNPIIGNAFPFKDLSGPIDYFYGAKGAQISFISDFQLSCLNCPREGYLSNKLNPSKIILYPNPSNDFIEIGGEFAGDNVILNIYNMQGECCYNVDLSALSNKKISIENLPNGIYTLLLTGNISTYQSTKFVINR